MSKITMVGGGNVGATAVNEIAQAEICEELVMIDIVENLPQGKSLDMWEQAPILGYDTRITGSNTYDAMAGSDLVLITAGLPRKPGMSRSDLLDKNAAIVGGIVDEIVKGSPNAIVILVTNPLDVMTYLAWKRTGWDRSRVVGQAGVLDSARMRSFIALELNISVKDVQGMVLGGHGDSMVPIAKYTTVAGIPIEELMPKDKIEAIFDRTRKGGGEIVQLLNTSAWYAPGTSVAQMAESIMKNQKRVLPCCAVLDGEYGLNDVAAGVPCVLGRNGIERIIELDIPKDDLAALQKSANDVKEDIARL